jgi:flavin-dependent thymidylate synthase
MERFAKCGICDREGMASNDIYGETVLYAWLYGGYWRFICRGHCPRPEEEIMEEKSREIQKWADVAMYPAQCDDMAAAGLDVEPQVYLVSMTPRPLQVMAAAAELYAGNPVYDPRLIGPKTARNWFRDMTRTALQAPLEFIDLHFFFAGVTRAFTHQLVRQRTAVYVQESQRFAVKRDAAIEISYPPGIAKLPSDHPMRVVWDKAVENNAWAYNALVDGGIPAEDARGLLPTNITTRVHYKTNLRNLAEHAGLRLCSQAQFEWKMVWFGMIDAIRNYGPAENAWQQEEIARLFKPICYQTGRCEFRAETDRACRIRDRVEAHHAHGEGPEQWTDIDPREPLIEGAARIRYERPQ